MATALVTGASSGIGAEIARVLAGRGDEVVLVARSAPKLEALAAELGGARVLPVDLSDPSSPREIAAAVPQIDILVNNAGVGLFGPFVDADSAQTSAMIQLNAGALTDLTRRYLPQMVERGSGRVLNVASTAAFQPGPLMAVYYATKAYVLSFSEALAEELRGSGVTVTAVCPGPTATGFQQGAAMEDSGLVKGRRLPSSAEVAAYAIKAMDSAKVVAIPGAANKLLAQSVRLAPRALLRRTVKWIQAPR